MWRNVRVITLSAVACAGAAAVTWSQGASGVAGRASFITTAHQLGIVGYRDPVGAIWPDGTRVVFAEGRRLYSAPVGGGPRRELAVGVGQIRHVTIAGEAVIFEDSPSPTRVWRVVPGESPAPFGRAHELNGVRQLAGAPDGRLVGLSAARSGTELVILRRDGSVDSRAPIAGGASFPAFAFSGTVACVVATERGPRVSLPCGSSGRRFQPDVDVVGPLAFSPDDSVVYFASPNAGGTIDLWSANVARGHAQRLSGFARDSYAPSVTRDGRVLFKTQTYRTNIAEFDIARRTLRELTAFQAETPSYDREGTRIAVTYGSWRRVIDDAKYPDIAQDIGLIAVDRLLQRGPIEVIAQSDSEDQAMSWSPNGKWIAFHSHREISDDVWLRSADGKSGDRRISFLGRGAEVGWPRWSPHGAGVLFNGARKSDGRSVNFIVGVDQDIGAVTSPPQEVPVSVVEGEMMHSEWLDEQTIAGIIKTGPGQQALYTAPATGGAARVVHRVATDHDFPGMGVSPDGQSLAFIQPADDGVFQLFRVPVTGGAPEQLTFDRSHKSQPAWAPDGLRIAVTVWEYHVQFWLLSP
ncbi:MAG: PD40 domain-containing protein [Acidobacteria bacterium]|nr:PD40 domain-containing protein [Acidobacteriota bacterium]